MSFVKNVIDNSSLSLEKYKTEYKNSIENPDNFWKEKAKTLDWIKDFSEIKNSSFKDNAEIKWFYHQVLKFQLPYSGINLLV